MKYIVKFYFFFSLNHSAFCGIYFHIAFMFGAILGYENKMKRL